MVMVLAGNGSITGVSSMPTAVTFGSTLATASQGISSPSLPAGTILQIVNYSTTTATSSTAQIPWDNTIPQITEGFELFNLAITPKSATSKLYFNVTFNGYSTVENSAGLVMALFQNGVSNALATQIFSVINSNFYSRNLQYYMTAGTTSTTTFSVRMGNGGAGTTYVNSSTYMGGTMPSSITIMEIAA